MQFGRFWRQTGVFLILAGFSTLLTGQTRTGVTEQQAMVSKEKGVQDFYDFKVGTLYGGTFDFSELKGKRVLIVNTASECGFTPQYAELEQLFEQYGGDHFTVIGFPSNNFGGQEPGSNEEIAQFCKKNFGVSFPMMEKVDVQGKDKNPVFAWLTEKSRNGVDDYRITWNFNKFLVDEHGNWVAAFPSKVSPMDEQIVAFAKGETW